MKKNTVKYDIDAFTKEIDETVEKMLEEGKDLKRPTAFKVAVMFDKKNPECGFALATIEKYVLKSRRGEIIEEKNYDKELFNVGINREINKISNTVEEQPRNDNFIDVSGGPDFTNPLGKSSKFIDFPESWSEHNDVFNITGVTNLGVCNDIHLPYHDKFAVQACFSEFKKRKVNGIYLNGDIMDMENVSRFGKETKLYLKDEIDIGREFLGSLRDMFPNIPMFYKSGNHEKRLEAFISGRCENLRDLYGLDMKSLLELDKHDIQYVEEQRVARFGKLWIAHGHELGLKSGTVNIARQVRMRVGVNIMFGHWHKNQNDSARNLADEVHSSWALGSLCYLKPRYTGVLNQWTQGGATIQLHEDGQNFTVSAFQIQDGVVI